MHTNRKSMRFGAQQSCKTAKRSGFDFATPEWPRDFYSKPPSCSTCRLAGRMAIHAVKVEDFHSKPPCPALAPLRMKQGQSNRCDLFCQKDDL